LACAVSTNPVEYNGIPPCHCPICASMEDLPRDPGMRVVETVGPRLGYEGAMTKKTTLVQWAQWAAIAAGAAIAGDLRGAMA
jgi:hypothetical protein